MRRRDIFESTVRNCCRLSSNNRSGIVIEGDGCETIEIGAVTTLKYTNAVKSKVINTPHVSITRVPT